MDTFVILQRRTYLVIITVITPQHWGGNFEGRKQKFPFGENQTMTQQGFPSLELADWIMRLIIISVAAKSFHTSAGVCSS